MVATVSVKATKRLHRQIKDRQIKAAINMIVIAANKLKNTFSLELVASPQPELICVNFTKHSITG